VTAAPAHTQLPPRSGGAEPEAERFGRRGPSLALLLPVLRGHGVLQPREPLSPLPSPSDGAPRSLLCHRAGCSAPCPQPCWGLDRGRQRGAQQLWRKALAV